MKELNETYLYNPSIKTKDAIDLFFCFPASYSVGMSSLGYLTIFKNLDLDENINPQRVFLDSEKVKISEKSLMSFSFSFELDFIQVFKMLEKMNIAILKRDRPENAPLIFAGGPVVSTNPEPFVDFFDFFVVGDGEKLIVKLANEYNKIKHLDRNEILTRLAKIKGIYVPEKFNVEYNDDNTISRIYSIDGFYQDNCIEKHIETSYDSCLYSSILSDKTVFSDTFLIEIERGCSQKCFFCIASYLNLPVRWPSKELIIDSINHGLKHTRKIGLLGALITEHPDFEYIINYIYEQHKIEPIKLTTSSLRADKINDNIAMILSKCNQKQITISLEAGTERLRNKINKKLSDNDIRNCVYICHRNNINTLKMYAIIGLPTETEDDIRGLVDLVSQIKKEYSKVEIILSLNSFVPKSHTPFERVSVQCFTESKAIMTSIKKDLLKVAKVRASSAKWDLVQAVISRGDRRLGPLLHKFYFYGATLGSFNRAFKDFYGYLPDQQWYALRERMPFELLPWSHIRF